MLHCMELFWQSAYTRYEIRPGEYEISHMPDPILSARFGKQVGSHLNIIQNIEDIVDEKEGYNLRNNFYLCTLKRKEVPHTKNDFIIKNLDDVRNDPLFLHLLKDGFAKDYLFLQTLMGFLPTLDARFKVGFLTDNGTPYSCVIIGIAGRRAVLLSGVIAKTHRGQKKSRRLHDLIHTIAWEEDIEEYFFWTLSEKLLGYVDTTKRYLIYTQKN